MGKDNDAISRADTIEWLKRVTVTDGITFETGFKQILADIQNMPSLSTSEIPNKWIPVSERLPENSGNYLITYCYRDEIETQEAVYVKDEEGDKWFDITDIEITLAVIAWMPLPEPYEQRKGEE